MPNCSVCGKSTQLHVVGVPICVACDLAAAEAVKVQSKPPKRSAERAATVAQSA
jgi:hypothetical protein